MTTVDGNIETLSRAILGEAQAEIEEVKGRSQSRAEAIRNRARANAEQQKADILAKARQDARRLKDQSKATAQLKARTLELAHREQLLEKVFRTAAERLRDAPAQKDFGEITLRLLREALAQLRTSSAVIRADRATQAVLTKSALEKVSREAGIELRMGDALETGTGVVAQAPDGHLQFDNTLENRLGHMQSALRAEVYRVLTGASS